MDERIVAFAFASSIAPVYGVVRPLAPAFSYSPTTTLETPLPKGVPPVKLLGEESGAVAIGAESVTSVVRGAFEWLQVASTLPVDGVADAMVARRLAQVTGGLKSRPIARPSKG
jgi:hypothetical protein